MGQDGLIPFTSEEENARVAALAALRRARSSLERRLDAAPPDGEVAYVLRRVLPPVRRAIDYLSGDTSGEARVRYMREYMRKRRAKGQKKAEPPL